ncbi:MAG: CDP-diacylglycerol--serine O-phosphatidyltransferase [Odoribacter sp.]
MIKKHIPNIITCMNVLCGTSAIFMAMYGHLMIAAAFIILGMIFDFFDGLTARILHVKSDMGKELDSLADMVSFGVAPTVLAHFLILAELPGGDIEYWSQWSALEKIFLFCPLLIPAFSAYRLAKFNLDVRQTTSFIGMPTPANALFWVCLVFGGYYTPEIYNHLFGNAGILAISAIALSLLLVSELPMFSLKISGFSWQANKIRYIYFICLIVAAGIWGTAVIVFIIPLYILFTLAEMIKKIVTTRSH